MNTSAIKKSNKENPEEEENLETKNVEHNTLEEVEGNVDLDYCRIIWKIQIAIIDIVQLLSEIIDLITLAQKNKIWN